MSKCLLFHEKNIHIKNSKNKFMTYHIALSIIKRTRMLKCALNRDPLTLTL